MSRRPKVGSQIFDIHAEDEGARVYVIDNNSYFLGAYDHGYKTAMTCDSLAYFLAMSPGERRGLYVRVFPEIGVHAWIVDEEDLYMAQWWIGFEDGTADRSIRKSDPFVVTLVTLGS